MHVVVAGAGPGGASAALALARAGARVDLVEKHTWPRAKTCGDGVSPLAIRELRELGADVEPGLELRRALVHTPRGTAFRGAWPAATPYGTIVERRAFDDTIVAAALRAGASFLPATEVRAVVSRDADAAVTLWTGGAERVVHADAVIVADGAGGRLAAQLGFPPYRTRVVAIRGYATARRELAPEYGLFYDRELTPGYGWIFPVDRHRANLGVCVDERMLARAGGNARVLLARWLAGHPLVRELFGDRVVLEDERGGIIPSGRAQRVRGRALLVGDAAGVADPFTAEGIYESIASGRLAAEALIAESEVARAGARYEKSLRALDVNERAARLLRATFTLAIEPYARYATQHPRFGDRLMTDVFFAKPAWPKLFWNMHFGH